MTTGFLEGHQAVRLDPFVYDPHLSAPANSCLSCLCPIQNGAFVACGPPGFTALALIKLGEASRTILPEFGLISPMAGEIWYAGSVMGALMLLGLALFFFVFGAIPYGVKVHKHLVSLAPSLPAPLVADADRPHLTFLRAAQERDPWMLGVDVSERRVHRHLQGPRRRLPIPGLLDCMPRPSFSPILSPRPSILSD